MPDARKPPETRTEAVSKPLVVQDWTGAGLCPEAQGDGVPCQGTEGECETCGRALPRRPSS